MIANELENSTAEYLAYAYGTPLDVSSNPIEVMKDGELISIYRGEGNTSIALPAVIVSCDSTTREEDSPNWHCTMNIMVRIQKDPGDDNPNPIARLDALSRVMYSAMLMTDIHHRVNQYASPDFSVIAFVNQAQNKEPRDRTLDHSLLNVVYCANINLN